MEGFYLPYPLLTKEGEERRFYCREEKNYRRELPKDNLFVIIIVVIVILSFKRGLPTDADLVFDVRILPNPHWQKSLRLKTGRDPEVVAFLEEAPLALELFDDLKQFVERWLPRYRDNNRSYVTIALGCTGGQHRSVYLAEKLYRHFREHYPEVNLRHRELQG